MPSLRELQTGFSAAVFTGGEAAAAFLADCVAGGSGVDAARAERGLAAYRSSVLANLAVAVEATYPVVAAIVGQEFLAAAARRYARERPSGSGDLNAYGHDFGDFLATYEAAAELPYLPDVARLEWLVQQVYGAADASAQDLVLLASTAPERWGELRFRLDPAHGLFASSWPVARIWTVNQPGYAGDFLVDFDQAETVLVHRRAAGTAVEAVAPGDHALLWALAAGESLERAVEAAAGDPAFDLPAALQRYVAAGLLLQAY
ncbi:MAG: DUF2063 domain-containing protein [Rhodocyclaceae bacterium]|nr:MAG: DUF2063 domain-containing protein [Rhodocyclaceae bacterium]